MSGRDSVVDSTSLNAPRPLTHPPESKRRPRPSRTNGWRDDGAALAALLAIIAVTVGFRFIYDNWLAQFDIFNFFLPNYDYVGGRLRAFQVPAWNPYFSSGTPMAGDAGGGWMYLPVMIAFSLFTGATAMKAMVLLQTLIGALATYLFARRLEMLPVAALVAATTLAVGPALYDATGQSTVVGQVAVWLPVGMAGAECALQAPRWSARLLWAGVAGIGLVQMFAAWPQGFMYGALLMAAWFLYRGLIDPPPGAGARPAYLRHLIVAGLASILFTAALGAAAILPRLDFSAQSNIPGGDYSNVPGGQYADVTYGWITLLGVYLRGSYFWRIAGFSTVIVLLALLALTLGPRRYGAPFWAGSILVFIDLAATHSLTRRWFYLLPLFKTIHGHRPTATMYMVFLPLAILAGAGLQAVLRLDLAAIRHAWPRLLLPLTVLLLALLVVAHPGESVAWPQIALPVLATLVIMAAGSRWLRVPARGRTMQTCGLILLALILVWPSGVDFVRVARYPANDANNLLSANPAISQQIDTVLAPHDPGTAAALLQYLQATQPPFRYAPYFGSGSPGNHNVPSSWLDREPGIMAILTNARSVQLGLEQISGYNPMHLADYVNYMTAMNGTRQNYHWLDVYAAALDGSQLLDMLNVRYILVPASLWQIPPTADDRVVYRDDRVVVYENTRAFPRAWIVHQVLPDHGEAGLAKLASGEVDGHEVAFVSGATAPPPNLAAPSPVRPLAWTSTGDQVTVTDLQPERIAMRTSSTTAGYLVVSEPYARGWRATIDGRAVPIRRTDYALQGVSLPTGSHTVVLTYAPRSLAIGLPVTGGATLALLGVGIWAIIDRCRRDRRRT